MLHGMTTASTDSTRTITRSAARFFSGTMLSRITGMLRDMCMAYAFGTQSAIAALLVAFRFAHLLRRLLGEGAMQTALIPHFEELRKESPLRAAKFFSDLAVSLTYVLVPLIIIIMACLSGILAWGILDSGNQEITWLTFLMMPSLLFICLFGINASLLQCEKSYFSPSAAPVVFNLFWIVGIIVSSTLPVAQAMSLLSFFVIGACFAQWAVTLPKTYAILRQFGLNNLWRNGRRFSSDVLRLGKPLALGIVGVAGAQINNAMDAIFARWADAEGPAFLWYAIRLQQLPLGLFGIALAGALLPPLSRAVKANDHVQSQHFLDFAMRRTLALMVPITCILLLLGDGCINLIYGHGDFTNASVLGTTQCLWGYTLGLVPMALVLVLAPAFYAKGDYRTPTQASLGSMGVNLALNFLLVPMLGMGTASIAVATSVSAWVNLIWLAIATDSCCMSRDLLNSAAKTLFASFAAACAVFFVDRMIWESFPAVEILQGSIPTYQITTIGQIVRLGIEGTVFLAIFAITAIAIKAKDVTHLLKKD